MLPLLPELLAAGGLSTLLEQPERTARNPARKTVFVLCIPKILA
jgi:hypothetical protein